MKIVEKKYYALVSPKKEKQVKTKGLVSNRKGEIQLFNKLKIGKVNVADHLAVYRFKLDEYLLLTIDSKGISGKLSLLHNDELMEKTELLLHQKLIDAKFISVSKPVKPDEGKLLLNTFAQSLK